MSESKPVVLVTGSNGFVGRHLAAMLTRDGWSVRRAVRCPEGRDGEVVIGSIGSETDWQAALAGVDAVVHLAARVHHPRERAADLYNSINVEGTLRLARSAARARVRTFVFLSTVLANGGCTDGRGAFTEADELAPRGAYGLSKARAEAGLKTISSQCEMKIFIVRPPLVYGAGAVGNFRNLVKAIDLGLPLPFALIRNKRAFIGVHNLGSFIETLLRSDKNGFRIYLVADSEQISTPDFITRIAGVMSKRVCLLPVSVRLLELAFRVTRPELRDSIVGSMEIDLSAALSTGWKPTMTMNEALKMALLQSSGSFDPATRPV